MKWLFHYDRTKKFLAIYTSARPYVRIQLGPEEIERLSKKLLALHSIPTEKEEVENG